MRCPDCNKFVPYDEPQCEVQSVDVNDDTVNASVSVQLNCAECGGTLKEMEIEAEKEILHDCAPDAAVEDGYVEGDDKFELSDEGDATGTQRLENKDRHGKEIKNSRYMRTFYGFEMCPNIKCLRCGEDFTVDLVGEEQASAFNECV